MAKIDLDLTINNQKITRQGVDGKMWLNDFLREELRLTGTKFCCGIAVCRVCTVAWQRVPDSLREESARPVFPLRCGRGQAPDFRSRCVTVPRLPAEGDMIEM